MILFKSFEKSLEQGFVHSLFFLTGGPPGEKTLCTKSVSRALSQVGKRHFLRLENGHLSGWKTAFFLVFPIVLLLFLIFPTRQL